MTLAHRLSHSTGTSELVLTGDRLVVKTHGTGLADRPRTIDVALAELRQFCMTGTIRAQNMSGTPAQQVVDTSRDSELIFSYLAGGRVKKQRLFVDASDPALQAIVSRLRELRPDASLLHLAPRDAYRTIGVLSPEQGLRVVLAVVIGAPVLVVLLWNVWSIMNG
jgi:hypothetical protein